MHARNITLKNIHTTMYSVLVRGCVHCNISHIEILVYGKSTLGTITIISHIAHVHTLLGTLVHTHTRTYHAGREELQEFQCAYFYLNFK